MKISKQTHFWKVQVYFLLICGLYPIPVFSDYESLPRPVSLSVLDYADQVVAEQEANDTPETAQVLDFVHDILAIGVEGSLGSGQDVDVYGFSVETDGQIELKFTVGQVQDQAITALAAGTEQVIYFIANNSLWRKDTSQGSTLPELLLDSAALAEAMGIAVDAFAVHDLAVTNDGNLLMTMSGSGGILAVDLENGLSASLIISTEDITAVTGVEDPNLVEIAVDGQGRIYVADQTSRSVLQIAADYSTVQYYTEGTDLAEAVERDMTADQKTGITAIPATIMAQTEENFVVNSLVIGRGAYAVSGQEVFYATQLSSSRGGDGGITKVIANTDDPDEADFSLFFDPNDEYDTINPSALVLDTEGTFGNKMYMGTFGPSLGDELDGTIYQVNSQGQISEFITSFVDPNGNPITEDGDFNAGFFDITDMAFSYGGKYGDYLYVLSENDNSDDEEDAFHSDLWRVSPDGVAHGFLSQFADRVISIVIGQMNGEEYLFVGTYASSSQISTVLRIDENGEITTIHEFESGWSVCDMAIGPSNSVLKDRLAITLKGSSRSMLVSMDAAGNQVQYYGGGLTPGDVSSGDLAFDDEGALLVSQNGGTNILKLNYEQVLDDGFFDFVFGDLQVRPETTDDTTAYTPYVGIVAANQPRIYQLSSSGDPDDTIAVVSPQYIDSVNYSADDSAEFTFVFDGGADPNMYIYVTDYDAMGVSAQGEDGLFNQFSLALSGSTIDSATGLTDVRVTHLALNAAGDLFAIGRNGTEVDDEEEIPSQEFDDSVLRLGNVNADAFDPNTVVQLAGLTQMKVSVAEPNGELVEEYTVSAAEEFAPSPLTGLAAGNYTVTVEGSTGTGGNFYDLVVSPRGGVFEADYVIAGKSQNLVNYLDENLRFTHTGSGQILLTVGQQPGGGKVVELLSLEIQNSKTDSMISGENLTTAGNLFLGQMILDGSLRELRFAGLIDAVIAATGSKGTIERAELGVIGSVDAANYNFKDFAAESLGDADIEESVFNAKSLKNLDIAGDITNVLFLEDNPNNNYDRIAVGGTIDGSTFKGHNYGIIEVDGTITDSTFTGRRSKTITVQNTGQEDNAISGSTFTFTGIGAALDTLRVLEGDVSSSYFTVSKKIGLFELSNGNLSGGKIQVSGQGGQIRTILIGRASGSTEEDGAGNITGSAQITAYRKMDKLHADGEIALGVSIRVTNYTGKLVQASCGGEMAGYLYAGKIGEVLAGFDEDGKKLVENGDFNGSDITGTISAFLGINKISTTGKFNNANITSSYSSITNIFAEDGFEETTVSAYKTVTRIMVGFLDGNRWKIINENADVSGSVTAKTLGRIYYTGTLEKDVVSPEDTRISGPLYDVIPGN